MMDIQQISKLITAFSQNQVKIYKCPTTKLYNQEEKLVTNIVEAILGPGNYTKEDIIQIISQL